MLAEGPSASEQITRAVTAWTGVTAGFGTRGEFAFTIGRRQLGHLHGDRVAHFNFPKEVWHELRKQDRIAAHPVFPDREGPAAREIRTEQDARDVIALLRLNYDRLRAGRDEPAKAAGLMR